MRRVLLGLVEVHAVEPVHEASEKAGLLVYVELKEELDPAQAARKEGA